LAIKAIEFGQKRKITANMPFKITEVGINRKPVCDFLLVTNDNEILFCTVSELSQLTGTGHFAFLSPPLGGLGTT